VTRVPKRMSKTPKIDAGAKYQPIRKKLTGIVGFDQVTGGGLPEGRCTTVMGGPGTGKSLFALQNLLHRHRTFGEAGLFVSFEEPVERVRANIAALNWSFAAIPEDEVMLIDALLPADAVQTGAFDLCGLLAGLSARKTRTGACNVVFDGLDALISNLNDEYLERRELTRIDEWIRSEGMSAIMTVKFYSRSEQEQKRADVIQYLTDCVVCLDGTLFGAKLSRTLRVVKYRGSGFAGNVVPMAIGQAGVEVIPAQMARSGYPVFTQRISSGIGRLDAILGGGYIRGSSILLSGAPGTSKSSLAACLVAAGCAAGQKAIFVSFDESSFQTVVNMKSIGIDLDPHVASGRLAMMSLQPSALSPEESFLQIWNLVRDHEPDILVVDPLSVFADTTHPFAAEISTDLIDLAKSKGITFLSTSLLDTAAGEIENSASQVSAIADTWLHVSYVVQNGERNRAVTIIKSRGTAHSNQVRELVLSGHGIDLVDVYVGDGRVLLGSARLDKQQQELKDERVQTVKHKRRKFEIERSIAELRERRRQTSEELTSKQQEAELEDALEQSRIEAAQASAAMRAQLRRQTDDQIRPPQRQRVRSKVRK
jgi:circadian clock protein KaiC